MKRNSHFKTQVGSNVQKFKPGDRVGVGPQGFSCMSCSNCDVGRENYCCGKVGFTGTYAAKLPCGYITKGGYSAYNRTHQRFVCRIPEGLPNEGTAPLLCAGITTYAPLKYAGVKVRFSF
jgi:D-arabinose 1-dehydrogenase-like Zn-dependent alcohol dehydrogenase